MIQAEALYHLQEIELGILRGQKRLTEIAAALQDSEVIKTARNQVESAQKTLAPLRVRGRDLDLEVQSNVQKTTATEQQLYSGSVKNPKQLQEMQQEIVSLKKWHEELENRLLENMVAVEEAEAGLASAEASLQKITAIWESQHQDLLAEKDQLERQMSSWQQQRQEALKQVTPESLKVYNNLKPRKNNQPIAVMSGRSCASCGIEQTSSLEQEVRRGHQLVLCAGCGRILVALKSS